MTATHAAPPREQSMQALERANEVRLGSAELKRRIADAGRYHGRLLAADTLLDTPRSAESMKAGDLLRSCRRVGDATARQWLRRAQVSDSQRLRTLTDRQRSALASLLEDAR